MPSHPFERLAYALALSGAVLSGCAAAPKIQGARMPSTPPLDASQASAVPAPQADGHYVVRRHDCLWTIAGRPGIYGDSFQWPLLFKANRDEIRDPDLIYPDQTLRVDKNDPPQAVARARRMAMLTPKYRPHTKPRTGLPVDYF